MQRARITSKGQVTIPAEVRKALGLKRGDYLVFELPKGETTSVRVVKGENLSALYGALPATRPYSGKEEVRQKVGRALARETSTTEDS